MIFLKPLQSGQEKYKREQNGSITIFMALTLVLILSFLFSVVEAARVNGLKELAKRKLHMEAQSLFGGYNQELWEQYGLLFLDMSYGTGEADVRFLEKKMMEEAYGEGAEQHFYQMMLKNVQVEAYALATDQGGAEFMRQACEAAKASLAVEGVEELKSRLSVWEELENESNEIEEKWQEALAAAEEAGEEEAPVGTEGAEEVEEPAGPEEAEEVEEPAGPEEAEEVENPAVAGDTGEEEVPTVAEDTVEAEALPENPINYVMQLKTLSLLALVMEDPSGLSGKGVDLAAGLDNRELFCGNMSVGSGNIVDKIWFIKYLDRYLTCAADMSDTEKADHVLDYELEYCIAGKDTDVKNLEAVVNKLLLVREAANFATIMQDSQKKTLALEIAVAAVGFTGLPQVIKAVQLAVLLAWCYVESVLDLRCLLSGGKVPLMKDSSQWKSDLFHIQEEVSRNEDSGEETGLTYREYLQLLLYATGEEKLTCHAMDVVERNIRLLSGNEAIRMDTMVSAVQIQATYAASPLFFHLIPATQKIDGSYYFQAIQEFSY